MPKPEIEQVGRLLRRHVFQYEHLVYGQYAPITPRQAEKRFPDVWHWIEDALGERHGVSECFLVLFPNEHQTGPSSAANKVVWVWSSCQPRGCAESGYYEDVWCLLGDLVNRNASREGPGRFLGAGEKVLACYFLHCARTELGHPSGLSLPATLDDFLQQDVYFVDCTTAELEHAEDETRISLPALQHAHPKRLPGGQERVFYQRLAVVFLCADPASARNLAAIAQHVVAGTIAHWGTDIELEKHRAGGAEAQARALIHEFGQVAQFLSPPSDEGNGQKTWLWPYPHFEEYLRGKTPPQRAAIERRAVVCPYRDFYDAVVAYILLYSDAKTVSTAFDDWVGRPLDQVLPHAVEWAKKAAFAMWFSRRASREATPEETAGQWSDFRGHLIPLISLEREGLCLLPQGTDSKDLSRSGRRLAMLITAAILNAMKHATMERSPNDFSRVVVLATPSDIVIANGCVSRPPDSIQQDGTSAALRALAQLIVDQLDGLSVTAAMGGLPSVELPNQVERYLRATSQHIFKTIVSFGGRSPFIRE